MRKRLEIWQNARKPRIRTLGNTQCEQMLLSAVVSQLDKAAASHEKSPQIHWRPSEMLLMASVVDGVTAPAFANLHCSGGEVGLL